MAEQMVVMELLKSDSAKDMLKEKLKKNIRIVIPSFMAIGLIISLCTVVSEKDMHKTCSYMDRYPLSNDVYAMICDNETMQIDIRRFHSGKPSDEGITLTKKQWQYLKTSVDHMDESILKAQNQL